jgi:sulfur-oxidizing protein SoxY
MSSDENAEHDSRRRSFLLTGGLYFALAQVGFLGVVRADMVDPATAFSSVTLADALAALGGVPVRESSVVLTLPETVENGSVVPISVSTTLPNVEAIYILADINPFPLAVGFTIPEGTEPAVSIRLKLAQSGSVYAVARAGGRLFTAFKETRVTLGGCA